MFGDAFICRRNGGRKGIQQKLEGRAERIDMFSFFKAGQIEYLQSSLLNKCEFLVHAFCTRRGGASQDDYASLNMSFQEGDEDNNVLQNIYRFAKVIEYHL